MRDPAARTGCGWQYYPDPGTPSTAAYGTRRGAMSTGAPGGNWVWDLEEAERLESLKRTSQSFIPTCPDIAYSTMPNTAWCSSTGRAIVLDRAGNPKYPRSAGGDCPSDSIVTNVGSCPSVSGFASGPGSSSSISTVCPATGPLPPACLQLLTSQSCSATGGLAQALSSGYPSTSTSFNTINGVLQSGPNGFTLPSGFVNDGNISIADTLTALKGLRAVANSGDGSRTSAAAQNLCMGTAFDPCALSPNDSGPFDPACITQAALKMGFASTNNLAGALNWNGLPNWGAVISALQTLKSQVSSGGSQAQAAAIQQVYGISIIFPKVSCNTQGIMMYRYLQPSMDSPLGTPGHFLGRYLLMNGFPNTINAQQSILQQENYVTMFVPSVSGTYQFMVGVNNSGTIALNDQPLVPQINCCNTTTTTPPTTLTAGKPNKLAINVNNQIGNWGFQMQMMVNSAAWQPMDPTTLFFPVDRRLPMLEFAFHKIASDSPAAASWVPSFTDTNNLIQTWFRYNAPIGQLAGRQCMIVNGPTTPSASIYPSGVFNYSPVCQGIRLQSMKSITMMLLIDSAVAVSQNPSIFNFYTPLGVNTSGPLRPSDPSITAPWTQHSAMFGMFATPQMLYPHADSGPQNAAFGTNFVTTGGTIAYPFGQWCHIAFVWDDDFSGYTMYLNGAGQAHLTMTPYNANLIMEQIRIGSDNYLDATRWSGGIAWFRAFDYGLNSAQIQIDMNDGWSSL